jgi:tetraacyldisaccharide 4'-kinase
MNRTDMLEILSGGRRGAGTAMLRGLLWLASKPCAAAMRMRRWAYRAGVFGAKPAGVPVISIGNLTAGGTGKTPMVAWVVGLLRQAGRRPAILIRGYKAVAGRSDEAEELRAATGAAVVVEADRVAGAAAAVAGGADVLVMDDGFQHRRLRRDLDVVLIDATCPWGFGHVLPRGLLREPPSALGDADAVVVTRADQADPGELPALEARIAGRAAEATLCRASHRLAGLIGPDGEREPPESLAGRRVWAFCGIGNPDAFFRTLADAGAEIVGRTVFDDHHAYGPEDLESLAREAAEAGAGRLVTTAKDRARTGPAAFAGPPLWTTEVRLEVTAGRDELAALVLAAAGPGGASGPAGAGTA